MRLGDSDVWRRLRTDPWDVRATPGSELVVKWDASADLGFHALNATVRVFADSGAAVSISFAVPVAEILKRRVHVSSDHYMAHYSGFSEADVEIAHRHQLLLIHPSMFNATRAQVRRLQEGTDPFDPADDVVVLCYVWLVILCG